jgi:hypothetical protein
MSRTLKIVLIVCAAIAVTCFGGVYILYQKYGKEIMEQGRVAMSDGEAFAANSDQNGCVSQSQSRLSDSTADFSKAAVEAMWLTACLGKSAPTPGFCDSVPTGRADREAWVKSRCADQNDFRCGVVAATVQGFCGQQRRG